MRSIADAPSLQAERVFLWTPVAFGCGAALYMAWRSEPPLWQLGVVALASVAAAVWVGRRTPGGLAAMLMLLVACGALGAFAGGWRTARVDAPIVPDAVGPRLLEGWVVDVDSPGSTGARLVVAPVRIGGLADDELPHRVRIVVKPEAMHGPGSPIRTRALLNRPPPPAAPGAYDFARDAYFRQLGGVGAALTPPERVTLPPPDAATRTAIAVNAFRWSLARRIIDRMGPERGGIAVAMVTGHEAWVTPETTQVMRDSGLAHVLSISGLHMAIVGGFVFFAVRLAAAAWPWLALRVSTKKLAAAAGLIAVLAYLALSGAPPPAVRAAVTASVAFVAILCGRRAITLRALAFAALVVLTLQPEAVLQPGFQMSFAATTALVALAEALPQRVREINTPWFIAGPQRAVEWVGLSLLISFVAGLATGPFAIQHFNRVASYGLIANLVTGPLTSFVMMPALAIGAVGEAAGVSAPALAVAGWSTALLEGVARWVSELPRAVVLIASAPAAALPVAFLGLLFVCLWSGPMRWLGLPAACAVLLWPREAPPDVWIAEGGANAAVVHAAEARLAMPDVRLFAAELWSRRRGLPLAEPPAFACSRRACRPAPDAEGPQVSLWRWRKPPTADEAAALCAGVDILIWRATAAPPPVCRRARIYSARDLTTGGSVELRRTADGWRELWTQPLRGDRPWTQVSDSGA